MATTTAPALVRITFSPIGEAVPAPGEKIGPRREKRIADATPYPLTIHVDEHIRRSRPATEAYIAGYVHCHVHMWVPTEVERYVATVNIRPDGTGEVALTSRGGIVYGTGAVAPAVAALVGAAA